MVSIFQTGISQNTQCDNLVGFSKLGHIYELTHYLDGLCSFMSALHMLLLQFWTEFNMLIADEKG